MIYTFFRLEFVMDLTGKSIANKDIDVIANFFLKKWMGLWLITVQLWLINLLVPIFFNRICLSDTQFGVLCVISWGRQIDDIHSRRDYFNNFKSTLELKFVLVWGILTFEKEVVKLKLVNSIHIQMQSKEARILILLPSER